MRQCRYCGAIYDNLDCPDCAKEHERAGRRPPSFFTGRKVSARNLDQQEGNAEEYFGDHVAGEHG